MIMYDINCRTLVDALFQAEQVPFSSYLEFHQKDIFISAHRKPVYNRQTWKQSKYSSTREWVKHLKRFLKYSYSAIRKKGTTNTWTHMDKSYRHYVKHKKLGLPWWRSC